jgi:uncharacterized protein (TIGR00251 family)
MSQTIWETAEGVFLKVLVKPKSRSSEFIGEVSGEGVLINLHAPAREGKANSELIKSLAKILGVSSSSIIVVAGQKSREKTLLITGTTIETVQGVLETFHNG